MYKLARWLYALGRKHEYDRVKNELKIFLSYQPPRFVDHERGIKEDDEHYKKRINGWFAAREIYDDFFAEKEDR